MRSYFCIARFENSNCDFAELRLNGLFRKLKAQAFLFCAAAFAHMRITIASHSQCLLEHSLLCVICAIRELRLLLLSCANLPVAQCAPFLRYAPCTHLLRCPSCSPHSAKTLICLLCTSDHKRFAGPSLSTNSGTHWSAFWIRKPW